MINISWIQKYYSPEILFMDFLISLQHKHSFSCSPSQFVQHSHTHHDEFPLRRSSWLSWTSSSSDSELSRMGSKEQGSISAIIQAIQAAVSTRFFENFVAWTKACAEWRHNMAAGIPFMEETGRKDVQNSGRSIWKNNHGFWTLFVTFARQNLPFLVFCFKSKLFQ